MKALGHRAEHFAQADGLRRGEAERPDHLLFGQVRAVCPLPPRRRTTPAVPVMCQPTIVVRRIHRVADAALHLDAQDERVQEIRARHRPVFGQRQNRRRHRDRPDG